jgi:hypothetical protein
MFFFPIAVPVQGQLCGQKDNKAWISKKTDQLEEKSVSDVRARVAMPK